MSADNWTICPECKKRTDDLNEARINAPSKAYGKVAQDVYEKLLEQAKLLIPLNDTLREDYGIGIYKGKFSVSYGASCSDCGFKFSYDYEQPLTPAKG